MLGFGATYIRDLTVYNLYDLDALSECKDQVLKYCGVPLKCGPYNVILYTSLNWLRQNINQSMNPQKTMPWWLSYGVCFVGILEKIDHAIMASYCTLICQNWCWINTDQLRSPCTEDWKLYFIQKIHQTTTPEIFPLTDCDLEMLYGNMDLGQHWFQ